MIFREQTDILRNERFQTWKIWSFLLNELLENNFHAIFYWKINWRVNWIVSTSTHSIHWFCIPNYILKAKWFQFIYYPRYCLSKHMLSSQNDFRPVANKFSNSFLSHPSIKYMYSRQFINQEDQSTPTDHR